MGRGSTIENSVTSIRYVGVAIAICSWIAVSIIVHSPRLQRKT
jgi:hypothetical protein